MHSKIDCGANEETSANTRQEARSCRCITTFGMTATNKSAAHSSPGTNAS